MSLRAACLVLAVVSVGVGAQTTLPLKAVGPTLVEIKNNGSDAVFFTPTFFPVLRTHSFQSKSMAMHLLPEPACIGHLAACLPCSAL